MIATTRGRSLLSGSRVKGQGPSFEFGFAPCRVSSSVPPRRPSSPVSRAQAKAEARFPFPSFIPPQLCQPVEKAPPGPQWPHEIKLDGFRVAARTDHGSAQLLTRTGLDWTDKYPSVITALANVEAKTAYTDGELCGVDDAGLPALPDPKHAGQLGFEGRRLQDGRRSKRARKSRPMAQSQMAEPARVRHRRLDPEGSRPHLGALLLGYYSDDGKLIYAGRVGTGLPVKILADLRRRLDPIARKTSNYVRHWRSILQIARRLLVRRRHRGGVQ